MPDIANVKVGVANVTWDSNDLGYTKGGVDVEVETQSYKVTVDQFGETPISDYIIGRNCTATTPLAETTIANMNFMMPGSTVFSTGGSKVEVTDGVGNNLIDSAASLRIRPKGVADATEDFTMHQANTPGNASFGYKLNEERVFNAVWQAYPNSTTGLLFTYGDPAAT